MKIIDFEKRIKEEISEDLRIVPHPTYDDICGVYLKDIYISVTLPRLEIFDEPNKDHKDVNGHPFRTIDEAMEIIRKKHARFSHPDAQAIMRAKVEE